MHKTIHFIVSATALSMGALLCPSGLAQTAHQHSHAQSTLQPSLADGEVRKVDAENGKITVQHGDIAHLDMPSMTMVFTVKDKAMLANLKAGDKIRFLVIKEGGRLLVTEIQVRP